MTMGRREPKKGYTLASAMDKIRKKLSKWKRKTYPLQGGYV